jgi:molybdopterin molybdotransferase
MIAFEDALRVVLEHTPLTGQVEMPVLDAAGMVTTRPLRARWPTPRFDQSAVDGYAISVADLGDPSCRSSVELPVYGELAAGALRSRRMRPGSAMRVFTGSPLPPGADAVVMQEHCTRTGTGIRLNVAVGPSENVRRRGEECSRGEMVLDAGTEITPAVIALLSTFGATSVRVRSRPRAAIVVIGDELVAPGRTPHRYGICDANGPALQSALRGMGLRDVRLHRAPDDARVLRSVLRSALTRCDVVITVGGASVGDHDHAGAVRAELGIVDHFDRVAMKPGKPTAFGIAPSGALVFSLPGNPVAALVGSQLFLRPVVRKMMGRSRGIEPYVQVRLGAAIRHRPGRLEWVRARIESLDSGPPRVAPLAAQGSHMLTGIVRADVLVAVPPDAGELPAGTLVQALPLRWD